MVFEQKHLCCNHNTSVIINQWLTSDRFTVHFMFLLRLHIKKTIDKLKIDFMQSP